MQGRLPLRQHACLVTPRWAWQITDSDSHLLHCRSALAMVQVHTSRWSANCQAYLSSLAIEVEAGALAFAAPLPPLSIVLQPGTPTAQLHMRGKAVSCQPGRHRCNGVVGLGTGTGGCLLCCSLNTQPPSCTCEVRLSAAYETQSDAGISCYLW